MGRMKSLMLGLLIAASALSGACASMGERSISEVKTNPCKFHDKDVTVEGVVTTSFGIPLVPFKVFRVSDGNDEMLVISDDSRIPSKNARVRVRGLGRREPAVAPRPPPQSTPASEQTGVSAWKATPLKFGSYYMSAGAVRPNVV